MCPAQLHPITGAQSTTPVRRPPASAPVREPPPWKQLAVLCSPGRRLPLPVAPRTAAHAAHPRLLTTGSGRAELQALLKSVS
jgi:hypothetical protein